MFNTSSPVVFLYHGVPRRPQTSSIDAASFEEHIRFLKEHCNFVSAKVGGKVYGSLRRPAVLLTFDDGFRNHAEVAAAILEKHKIPATFFISTRHSVPGQYLWFTYLRMLIAWFHGSTVKIDGKLVPFSLNRQEAWATIKGRLLALRPHPQAMYECIASLPPLEEFVPRPVIADECEGMPPKVIRELASNPLFTIGGHTTDHPYLMLCSQEETDRQLHENRVWLEQLTGKQCTLFAYPGGLFNRAVLNRCRREYARAFALEWSDIKDEDYAIHRMGVCARSRLRLGLKLWSGRCIPFKHIGPVRKVVHAVAGA